MPQIHLTGMFESATRVYSEIRTRAYALFSNDQCTNRSRYAIGRNSDHLESNQVLLQLSPLLTTVARNQEVDMVILSDDSSEVAPSATDSDDSLQIVEIVMKDVPKLNKNDIPPALDHSTSPVRPEIGSDQIIRAEPRSRSKSPRLFVDSSSLSLHVETRKRPFSASDILQMSESEGDDSFTASGPSHKKCHIEVSRLQTVDPSPAKSPTTRNIVGLTLTITPARSDGMNRGPLTTMLSNLFSSPLSNSSRRRDPEVLGQTQNKITNKHFVSNFLSSPTRSPSKSPISPKVSQFATKTSTNNSATPFVHLDTSSDPIINDTDEPIAFVSPKKRTNRKDKTTSRGYTLKELNAVNKIVRRKQDLLSQMGIHISKNLYNTKFKQDYMKGKFTDTEIELEDTEEPIIFWTRHVTANYDPEQALFIPCSSKVIVENNLVLYLSAEELFDMIIDEDFIHHLESDKETYPLKNLYDKLHTIISNFSVKFLANKTPHVIFIIEGFEKLISKLRSRENKKFRDLVTGMSELASSQGQSQKQNKKANEKLIYSVPSKEVDKILQYIQFETGITVFPVRGNQEAIEWLYLFTYTTSKSLYDRLSRNKDFAHLSTVGSGVDAKLTFVRSLALFKRMTQEKATKLYPKFSSLLQIQNVYECGQMIGAPLPSIVDASMLKFFTSNDPDENISID